MTKGRDTGSGRASGLAVVGLCLAAVACQQPSVGERVVAAAPGEGPLLVIEKAWIDLHGHAVATFTVTEHDVPLALAEVLALAPRFTLAKLTDHPADGQRAWESLVLTGAHVAQTLRPGGPDDPLVLANVRQPGYESASSLVDLGEGSYRYVFATRLTGFDPYETIRVGAWLNGVEEGSLRTAATFDFSPSFGPVEARDTVLDANCVDCHGAAVVAHETVAGVRLCLTCHTWQSVDVLSIDPAAIFTTTTTALTDPNPLELGRMLHRIHRGKDLPTLYQSTWNPAFSPAAWDPASPPTTVPAPFVQQKPGWPARDPLPGRKYSIFAEDGREVVFGRSVLLSTFDPYIVTTFATTMLLAKGGLFPRDLRDCGACHRDAAQGWVVTYGITRRTCSGCHPEVWYQASSPAVDRSRFPHIGGPQADDSKCLGCHVTGEPKLYASIEEAHVPPARSPRYSKPVVEILRVDDLVPGGRPKVTFRMYDRIGPIVPSLGAPVPAFEPDGPLTSYVPRRFAPTSIVIKIQGPTVPDYFFFSGVTINSGTAGGNPDPAALSTTSGTDEYVYTFGSTIPPGTAGTFVVGFEAKRFAQFNPPYLRTKDVFRWPFTGEPVNETAENVWVFVNTASGTWTQAAGSPGAVPRRTVVEPQKCLRCHDRIEFHGGARHDPGWCITCHTADLTDLQQRLNRVNPTTAGRLYDGGPVWIGATYDGIEERSTHFKVNMHRMHTGSRKGLASLEGIRPYALYFSKAYFFDLGAFPGDLKNCTLCHAGKSYLLESVPPYAPPTRGNETATIWHPTPPYGVPVPHDPDEPAVLPLTAACTGCHATGATLAHVEAKTVNGVETCTQCHTKGAVSVEVAHGLAPATGGGASASFSSIVQAVLVPRCATGACHAAGGTAPVLEAGSAYGSLVGVQSGESSLEYVDPNEPERSYLVHKLRGTASSVGGSVTTIMPPDGALSPADIAAIEAWIANGAPND